jgi:hypothetical protein
MPYFPECEIGIEWLFLMGNELRRDGLVSSIFRPEVGGISPKGAARSCLDMSRNHAMFVL